MKLIIVPVIIGEIGTVPKDNADVIRISEHYQRSEKVVENGNVYGTHHYWCIWKTPKGSCKRLEEYLDITREKEKLWKNENDKGTHHYL